MGIEGSCEGGRSPTHENHCQHEACVVSPFLRTFKGCGAECVENAVPVGQSVRLIFVFEKI